MGRDAGTTRSELTFFNVQLFLCDRVENLHSQCFPEEKLKTKLASGPVGGLKATGKSEILVTAVRLELMPVNG